MHIKTIVCSLLVAVSLVYAQQSTIAASADAKCTAGCGLGACGASSSHSTSYILQPDTRSYTGLYYGFPLTNIPTRSNITKAMIYFANITTYGVTVPIFSVSVLPAGAVVNEQTQSGSTVDQNGFYQCPGDGTASAVGTVSYINNHLTAPLELTASFKSIYDGGSTQFVVAVQPSWSPFSGGSATLQSHSANAQAAYIVVDFTVSSAAPSTTTTTQAATTTAPTTAAPTTTTTTTTVAPTTTTAAPTTTTTTTAAPTTTTTTTTVAPSTAPATTTTTTALPTSSLAPTTPEPTTTSGPLSTSAPDRNTNDATRVIGSTCIVLVLLFILFM